jgi:hypothetical protein
MDASSSTRRDVQGDRVISSWIGPAREKAVAEEEEEEEEEMGWKEENEEDAVVEEEEVVVVVVEDEEEEEEEMVVAIIHYNHFLQVFNWYEKALGGNWSACRMAVISC